MDVGEEVKKKYGLNFISNSFISIHINYSISDSIKKF